MTVQFAEYFIEILETLEQLYTVEKFYMRVCNLRDLIMENDPTYLENYFVACFIQGLKPVIADYVRNCVSHTLNSAYETALHKELELTKARQFYDVPTLEETAEAFVSEEIFINADHYFEEPRFDTIAAITKTASSHMMPISGGLLHVLLDNAAMEDTNPTAAVAQYNGNQFFISSWLQNKSIQLWNDGLIKGPYVDAISPTHQVVSNFLVGSPHALVILLQTTVWGTVVDNIGSCLAAQLLLPGLPLLVADTKIMEFCPNIDLSIMSCGWDTSLQSVIFLWLIAWDIFVSKTLHMLQTRHLFSFYVLRFTQVHKYLYMNCDCQKRMQAYKKVLMSRMHFKQKMLLIYISMSKFIPCHILALSQQKMESSRGKIELAAVHNMVIREFIWKFVWTLSRDLLGKVLRSMLYLSLGQFSYDTRALDFYFHCCCCISIHTFFGIVLCHVQCFIPWPGHNFWCCFITTCITSLESFKRRNHFCGIQGVATIARLHPRYSFKLEGEEHYSVVGTTSGLMLLCFSYYILYNSKIILILEILVLVRNRQWQYSVGPICLIHSLSVVAAGYVWCLGGQLQSTVAGFIFLLHITWELLPCIVRGCTARTQFMALTSHPQVNFSSLANKDFFSFSSVQDVASTVQSCCSAPFPKSYVSPSCPLSAYGIAPALCEPYSLSERHTWLSISSSALPSMVFKHCLFVQDCSLLSGLWWVSDDIFLCERSGKHLLWRVLTGYIHVHPVKRMIGTKFCPFVDVGTIQGCFSWYQILFECSVLNSANSQVWSVHYGQHGLVGYVSMLTVVSSLFFGECTSIGLGWAYYTSNLQCQDWLCCCRDPNFLVHFPKSTGDSSLAVQEFANSVAEPFEHNQEFQRTAQFLSSNSTGQINSSINLRLKLVEAKAIIHEKQVTNAISNKLKSRDHLQVFSSVLYDPSSAFHVVSYTSRLVQYMSMFKGNIRTTVQLFLSTSSFHATLVLHNVVLKFEGIHVQSLQEGQITMVIDFSVLYHMLCSWDKQNGQACFQICVIVFAPNSYDGDVLVSLYLLSGSAFQDYCSQMDYKILRYSADIINSCSYYFTVSVCMVMVLFRVSSPGQTERLQTYLEVFLDGDGDCLGRLPFNFCFVICHALNL